MDQAIQKATAERLTFQKQPEKFLEAVGSYMETIQLVYRSKLPVPELELWRETLKDYSYQEFNQAMTHLISNPPKYELDDGTIQVWRGMPKLPDVVDVMLDFMEKAVQDAEKRKGREQAEEEKRNEERRRLHPEEFIGMKELQEIAQKLQSGGKKTMPTERTVRPDLDLDRNAEKLRQQAETLLKSQTKGDIPSLKKN